VLSDQHLLRASIASVPRATGRLQMRLIAEAVDELDSILRSTSRFGSRTSQEGRLPAP
jgi:hypothetical protein